MFHFLGLPATVQFNFRKVKPLSALEDYIKIGNRLKDINSDSGMSAIEHGIAQFVESVKEYGSKDKTAAFMYLYGSSGLGKTQLVFALNRKVLYIPLGE